jgi:hypothetical protein
VAYVDPGRTSLSKRMLIRPSTFAVSNVKRSPIVNQWDVSRNDVAILRIEVTPRGPLVGVRLFPLPQARLEDAVSEEASEAHNAFHLAMDRYNWVLAGRPVAGSFRAIGLEDWRDIEDALDAEHALDVP